MAFLKTSSLKKARQREVIEATPKHRPTRIDWNNVWKNLTCSLKTKSIILGNFFFGAACVQLLGVIII